MMSTFPAPVLSIAPDAVRDLEGGEALSGLWRLFTKCKESLQDGQRLENISWRMWYREMAATHTYRPLTPETSSSLHSESRNDFPFFQAIDEKQICHDESLHPSIHCPLGPSSKKQLPCLNLRLSISFGGREPTPSIGKFIVDILPHNTVTPTRKHLQHISQPQSIVTQPRLPTVCLPSTPPSTDALFPRVVVVNPTPHPTPPATPTMDHSSPPVPSQLPSTHLLPPLLSPALVSMVPSIEESPPNPQLPPPRMSRQSKPGATTDEMLKASDRRFFLQQSPERESPERDGSTDGGKVSDIVEASSGGSSRIQVKGSAESDRPAVKTLRKGKDAVRHMAMVRPGARRGQIARPAVKRQISVDTHKHKPTFNIGSSSSNGSKGARNGSESSKIPPPPPAKEITPPKRALSPIKAHQTQGRRIVVASSVSSDYETTDSDDDDSWCSEEMSVEETEKMKEENRLREAALEAQRQRDMFAKVPKRSYSNLNRTRSGLLSVLLNPNPNIFPPNHPYRTSFSSQDITQLPRRNVTAGFTPLPPLATSKSTAALPQAAQITARAPSLNGTDSRAKADSGYQPKGRPHGQEMEEETDSDEENADDKIQVSRSVAQQRLAALVGRRSVDRAQPSRLPQPAAVRPSLSTINSTPIPFGHPYNLPAPAPPSTPRTTRRQMLATELSESLRRNLLWERQVSKNLLVGQRRQSATTLGGLRPLTSQTTVAESSRNSSAEVERSISHQGDVETAEKEERKRRAMARNRSWADDYHYSGW